MFSSHSTSVPHTFTMEDLSGLEWSSSSRSQIRQYSQMPASTSFPVLRPSPSPSGSGPSRPPTKPSTPANDSFSGLVSFGSAKSDDNLSLAERQKKLQLDKLRQEAQQKERLNAGFNAQDNRFWDTLGQGGRADQGQAQSNSQQGNISSTPSNGVDDDDLLSAFSAGAPVNSASHFPPQTESQSRDESSGRTRDDLVGGESLLPSIPDVTKASEGHEPKQKASDPFGLGEMDGNRQNHYNSGVAMSDGDDLLGLGEEATSAATTSRPPDKSRADASPVSSARREEAAVAELVDMGFPVEKARDALSKTETGLDVQRAVGILIDAAHKDAKQGSRREINGRHEPYDLHERASRSMDTSTRQMPAWMRDKPRASSSQRQSSQVAANGDVNISQVASEIGSNLFKSANTMWKTGKKKVQKAVVELQDDHDPNQPKWMREVQREIAQGKNDTRAHKESSRNPFNAGQTTVANGHAKQPKPSIEVTDEALMLEMGGGPSLKSRPAEIKSSRGASLPDSASEHFSSSSNSSRRAPHSFHDKVSASSLPAHERELEKKLGRMTVEEHSSQAYVSPARRRTKKPLQHQPDPATAVSRHVGDPLDRKPPSRPPQPLHAPHGTPSLHIRPKPPKRTIPPITASALASSATHRIQGSELFRKGDFSGALTSYTQALCALPPSHPLTIVLLSNRALVNLKLGDSKVAVSDVEAALDLIGPAQGEDETIDLGGGEGEKPMHDFFANALVRKAEGLEQMEKWAEAADAWKEAVEAGVGGSTSIQGRDRCELAAGRTQKPTPTARPAQFSSQKQRSTPAKPAGTPSAPPALPPQSTEAVARLRQANAAAERADEEKFALSDTVDARLAAWKAGKQENLRALLCSLDSVLWPEAGWKKVGMHELVLANKVKVVYMRGIAKVHPDKVSLSPLPLWM